MKIANPGWLASIGLFSAYPLVQSGIGMFLPWMEVVLALMLFLPQAGLRQGAQLLIAGLCVVFIPVLVFFLAVGKTDCGCGGPEALSHPLFGIIRNIGMAIYLLWYWRNERAFK